MPLAHDPPSTSRACRVMSMGAVTATHLKTVRPAPGTRTGKPDGFIGKQLTHLE